MSSRNGGRYPSNPSGSDPLQKGKSVVPDTNLDKDGWEVFSKKGKNKTVITNTAKPWGQPPNANAKAWGNEDTAQKLGMRNSVGQGRGSGQTWPTLPLEARKPAGRGTYAAATVIPPPLKNAWGKNNLNHKEKIEDAKKFDTDDDDDDDDDDESDAVDNESDDELQSDDFDSDDSQKSHETRKKNRWFKDLFECLDGLNVEQINDPDRQWHCPACKGGPGAIDWYRGLQPLVAHAKTKKSKRTELHKELALLLEEELRKRGTSVVPAGESFGKWKALGESADREIVWPPMVIVMNTKLGKDDNDKWLGMGNQELLDSFSDYSAVRARHSYGPQGHRGMSVLIFEASAVGYTEAERLSKHFEDTGRDRRAWDNQRMLFYQGGKRNLYGYMAEKQDMEHFNQHSQGKTKLKYEMRSYKEMVVNQMKQMSEDNQQLMYFKNKAVKEQTENRALKQTFSAMNQKLRQTLEENRIVKLRTKKHHEQNKEEMDYQEQFFREQIQQFYDARNAKEEEFEKIQQDQREKVTLSEANISSGQDSQFRNEEIKRYIQSQDEKMAEYIKKRDELMKACEDQKADLKRKHFEEERMLQEQINDQLNKLMLEYTPKESN